MCHTPYCFGDCEECLSWDAYVKEAEEASKECPYRKECNCTFVNVKTDKCTTCGKIFNY